MKKHKNVKSIFSYLYNRTVIVGISICIQAVVLVIMLARFSHYFPIFYSISILLSIGAVLWLVNNRANPAYKIVWILVIMAFPVFGGIFYLMFSGKQLSRHQRKKMQSIYNKVTQYGTFQQRQDLKINCNKILSPPFDKAGILPMQRLPPFTKTPVENIFLGRG